MCESRYVCASTSRQQALRYHTVMGGPVPLAPENGRMGGKDHSRGRWRAPAASIETKADGLYESIMKCAALIGAGPPAVRSLSDDISLHSGLITNLAFC